MAHNDKYFTAPSVARRLRSDCGFLPAFWANDGDYILVEDVQKAEEDIRKIDIPVGNVTFVTFKDLPTLPSDIDVSPWGWDEAIVFQLVKKGLKSTRLPGTDKLQEIRKLSSRTLSSSILQSMHDEVDFEEYCLVGESTFINDVDVLKSMLQYNSKSVLKELWSCSGRGNRIVGKSLDTPTENWVRNVMKSQGGIMIEPFYEKVEDFGMEFYADEAGVHYRGLSVFTTTKGFYTGNVIAQESVKRSLIDSLLPDKTVSFARQLSVFLTPTLSGLYKGPLGVDMMVVKNSNPSVKNTKCQYLLHPMVEINLRRTMGHVAIDLMSKVSHQPSVMRIAYDGKKYNFGIEPYSLGQ